MEEKFDFEEAARECDKGIFMMYYDEALINRNFILKIRKLLKSEKITPDIFKGKVLFLNAKLKVKQFKHYQRHLTKCSCQPDKPE
jgi:hypothetical protein